MNEICLHVPENKGVVMKGRVGTATGLDIKGMGAFRKAVKAHQSYLRRIDLRQEYLNEHSAAAKSWVIENGQVVYKGQKPGEAIDRLGQKHKVVVVPKEQTNGK